MTNRAKKAEGNRLHFYCPGCSMVHGIFYDSPSGWTWNGSLELPTISPSVLMERTMGNFKAKDDPEFRTHQEVCHSFVTDGRIQFLSDCTHSLANQTVDLPTWPYDY